MMFDRATSAKTYFHTQVRSAADQANFSNGIVEDIVTDDHDASVKKFVNASVEGDVSAQRRDLRVDRLNLIEAHFPDSSNKKDAGIESPNR